MGRFRKFSTKLIDFQKKPKKVFNKIKKSYLSNKKIKNNENFIFSK